MDARIDVMEQELEMVKEQLQKLPGIERSLEQMAQNMVRSLQSMEETQKMVAGLVASNGSVAKAPAGIASREQLTEGSARQKETSSEHRVVSETGPEKRSEGQSLVGGTWAPPETAPLTGREWQGGRRLEMPIFTGENPDGWLFQAERYFNMNRLSENEKMAVAGVSFEGDALLASVDRGEGTI